MLIFSMVVVQYVHDEIPLSTLNETGGGGWGGGRASELVNVNIVDMFREWL